MKIHNKSGFASPLEIPMESFTRAVKIVLKDSKLLDAPFRCGNCRHFYGEQALHFLQQKPLGKTTRATVTRLRMRHYLPSHRTSDDQKVPWKSGDNFACHL